jgi:hypothetical protein
VLPLSDIELMVRTEITQTILEARAEGEDDDAIKNLILDVYSATDPECLTLGDLYRSETIHACFTRQMEAIFTPEGIKLC